MTSVLEYVLLNSGHMTDGIRVGIFYACKQEKSQEKFERERDFDESCSNFKNYMERKKEEQK